MVERSTVKQQIIFEKFLGIKSPFSFSWEISEKSAQQRPPKGTFLMYEYNTHYMSGVRQLDHYFHKGI